MADLAALIARVEAAQGPDRGLDARLQQACFPQQRVMLDPGKAFGPGPKRPAEYGVLADVDLSDWDDAAAEAIDKDGIANLFEAPAYTASIDSALALVDRLFGVDAPALCYSYDLGWHASAHAPMAYTADLHLAVGDPAIMETIHGQGPSLPLAIILALLKALQARAGQ